MKRWFLPGWFALLLAVSPLHAQGSDHFPPPIPSRQEGRSVPPSNLYREALRPQYHFSARQGWLNDPNGLVYFEGQYHLFFQHTPGSRRSGAKSWGHAVSTDLVHWIEQSEALDPDADGDMWSGSAVVDWHNSSGFGLGGKPPLVLIYTKAPVHDERHGQTSLAYSNDGVHFTKYANNPVLGNLELTNRDPRVFWHEPTKHWVLALYVEENERHNIRFYTSVDLRHWNLASSFAGGARGPKGEPQDPFLYECPDFWEMPLEGQPAEKKWVLTAGNTEYMVGSFDGKTFVPETSKLPGQRGRGYYAPQTFNEEPRGRRIRMGWLQTAAPGMPFTQSMSLPSEHKLVRTPEGPRLTWSPIQELAGLREHTFVEGARTLREKDANPFGEVDADLLEIRAEFTPPPTGKTKFLIRGVPVVYDAAKGELVVGDHHVPSPPVGGKQRLIIYADRLSLEVYASDGLTYMPWPVEFKPEDRSASVAVEGEPVAFERLDVYRLHSAWPADGASDR